MHIKDRQLLSRITFLGIFVAIVLGIFWLGKNLPKSEPVALGGQYEAGKATLMEYSDFQCPACGLYYPIVKQLKSDFGDKLTVVYKHYPLKSIHKNAELAARASEAALIQGKFQEMHDMIFEKQKEWSNSDQAFSLFTAYADTLGLNREKFIADVDSDEVRERVNKDYQEGIRLKISGTPTFFLNGKKINNPRSYNEFKQLIEQSIGQ